MPSIRGVPNSKPIRSAVGLYYFEANVIKIDNVRDFFNQISKQPLEEIESFLSRHKKIDQTYLVYNAYHLSKLYVDNNQTIGAKDKKQATINWMFRMLTNPADISKVIKILQEKNKAPERFKDFVLPEPASTNSSSKGKPSRPSTSNKSLTSKAAEEPKQAEQPPAAMISRTMTTSYKPVTPPDLWQQVRDLRSECKEIMKAIKSKLEYREYNSLISRYNLVENPRDNVSPEEKGSASRIIEGYSSLKKELEEINQRIDTRPRSSR